LNYGEYIRSELLLLIPVLNIVGAVLKKSRLPDRWIPLLLGGLGILLSAVRVLSTTSVRTAQETAGAVFTAVTQGILLAGASVYVHQLYVQSQKKT